MTTKNFQPPVLVKQTECLPLVDIPKITYRIGSYLETPNPDNTGGVCKSQYVVFCDVEHNGTSYRIEETSDNFSDVALYKAGFVNWAEHAITELISSAQQLAFSAKKWNALPGNMRMDDKDAILISCDVAQAKRAYEAAHQNFFGGREFTAQ